VTLHSACDLEDGFPGRYFAVLASLVAWVSIPRPRVSALPAEGPPSDLVGEILRNRFGFPTRNGLDRRAAETICSLGDAGRLPH